MVIKKYTQADELPLFDMLREEGDEWSGYFNSRAYPQYVKALETSITYVAYDGERICGYARCREDGGFGVYVYDLLVRKSCRGRQLGRMLMEEACKDFIDQPIYVTSDADPYYEKLGYRKEGTVFEVIKHPL